MRVLKKELLPHKINLNIDQSKALIDDIELWLAENCPPSYGLECSLSL